MNRGQTTLDFAIGVSIFVVVVAFVLAFVPGMLQPFEASTQQETAAADRLAERLAGGMLVEDPRTPYVFDRGCLIGFFALENTDGAPANDADAYPSNDGVVRGTLYDVTSASWWPGDCHYDVGIGIYDRMVVGSDDLDVRVQLRADVDNDGDDGILCLDADDDGDTVPDPDDRVIETDDPYASGECDMTGGDHDVAFTTGESPPTDSRSVVVARRVVHVEGGLADGTSEAMLIVEVW